MMASSSNIPFILELEAAKSYYSFMFIHLTETPLLSWPSWMTCPVRKQVPNHIKQQLCPTSIERERNQPCLKSYFKTIPHFALSEKKTLILSSYTIHTSLYSLALKEAS
jgi:hypothetical protein